MSYNIKQLVYEGYASHDCEAHYRCPYCEAHYGSWDLFHKGIKEHDAFVCDNCKNVISYGYFIESEK